MACAVSSANLPTRLPDTGTLCEAPNLILEGLNLSVNGGPLAVPDHQVFYGGYNPNTYDTSDKITYCVKYTFTKNRTIAQYICDYGTRLKKYSIPELVTHQDYST